MYELPRFYAFLLSISQLTTRRISSDFLDYYFNLLKYVHDRRGRLSKFKQENDPEDDPESYQATWKQYCGRERMNLRKHRTRLRQTDFQKLTQVGQGGYGQVFLAKRKETGEVCALKVMNKKLLYKMDEIRHVLTERDILTAADSPWLVKLLYAFQDETNIYLAMVLNNSHSLKISMLYWSLTSPNSYLGIRRRR